MRPQYDVERLIELIKIACAVPTSQLTYTEEDFTRIADNQLKTKVVPLMMSAREEYFVTHYDVSTEADGVVQFPSDAVGSKLRNVCFVQQANPLVLVNLPRIDLDVVAGVGFFNYATLAGFYIEGNKFILYPNTSVPPGTALRLYYYNRTLVLAEPDAYGRILSIDPMTNTVVLDFVPYDWAIGTEVNSVGSQPNFLVTNSLATVTGVSSPSLILDSVEGMEVGDYLSSVGYSAIPQVPVEAHNYLAQLSAVQCLKGLGDMAGAKDAAEEAQELKTNLLTMVSQRVDGSVKKVMPGDGGLRLGAGIRRRGWGW